MRTKTAATPARPAATPTSAPRPWEALPASAQRIYVALAGGNEDRAQQLLEADRQAMTTPTARRSRPRQGRHQARPEARPAATRRDHHAEPTTAAGRVRTDKREDK